MEYFKTTDKGSYCIVEIDRPKVNAINFQFLTEITALFEEKEKDDSCRGIILKGNGKIFTAGLDLFELMEYDEEKMLDFFVHFGKMYITLACFKKPFICAMDGYAAAGGTVIAIMADYRLIVDEDKHKFGLNEVALNIQISDALIYSYAYWLGQQKAYELILGGKLMTPKEAHSFGIIDKLCTSDNLLLSAENKMKSYLEANNDILINTKAKLRREWTSIMNENAMEEAHAANKVWWSEEVRQRMQMYLAFIKARKN